MRFSRNVGVGVVAVCLAVLAVGAKGSGEKASRAPKVVVKGKTIAIEGLAPEKAHVVALVDGNNRVQTTWYLDPGESSRRLIIDAPLAQDVEVVVMETRVVVRCRPPSPCSPCVPADCPYPRCPPPCRLSPAFAR